MDGLTQAWDLVVREVADVAARSREQSLNAVNQLLRRFRQYQGEGEWISVLLDGASGFASACAVFAVVNNRLELRGARNLNLEAGLSFEAASGMAFSAAIASKDVVVALKTPAEAGPELAQAAADAGKFCVAPVLNQSRVVAVVAAFGDPSPAAIELVAGMASLVLERQGNTSVAVQIAPAPASTQAPAPAPPKRTLPAWADLNDEDRTLHIRAQRFARTKVAEMQLENPEAGRAGREQNNVYLFWKSAIDAAREAYRKQFLQNRTMVDYLHLELIRSAAGGDESKMGADYPGPME